MSATRFTRSLRRRCALGTVLWIAALIALPVRAQEPAAAANPHWRADGCAACHASATPTAAQPALKNTSASALCATCHGGGEAAVCAHRSDIAVASDRVATIAEALRPAVVNGQVVCTTCHDMAPHCALDAKQRYRNRAFLRGGPFEDRGDECFLCHDKAGYRKPSPHMQSRKGGEFKEGTCIFCHGSVPQRDAAGTWQPAQYATNGNWSDMCSGCHAIGPHPVSSMHGKKGWIHMVVPAASYTEKMRATVAAKGGRMPLDPQGGVITCVTCHDPHDQRVPGLAVASTPGTKARLRYEEPCGACHDK